ncbi:type II toxin-antitoxin system Phd/YefM family antitoxin [Pectobacterium sp. B1J-3]|uniref:type II toxin-antitoxin system Phd/YefM family antitoxin n=1 Tax=Pectobacterium sp. B1J-3 TaxID=3385371 RepID=UPI003905B201
MINQLFVGSVQKINLYGAKSNFSKIIKHVSETGESYVIARNGKPVAKNVPLTTTENIGFMKGQVSARIILMR